MCDGLYFATGFEIEYPVDKVEDGEDSGKNHAGIFVDVAGYQFHAIVEGEVAFQLLLGADVDAWIFDFLDLRRKRRLGARIFRRKQQILKHKHSRQYSVQKFFHFSLPRLNVLTTH